MTQPGSESENEKHESNPGAPGEDGITPTEADDAIDGVLDDDDPADARTQEAIAAEVGGAAEEEEEKEFDFSAAPVSRPRPKPPVKRVDPSRTLKATAIPILITVGFALLIPGTWALLLLAGAKWVWSANRENARGMAMVMLVCWPIAFSLFFGALFFFRQVQAEKEAFLTPGEGQPQTPPAVPPTPQPSPKPLPKK